MTKRRHIAKRSYLTQRQVESRWLLAIGYAGLISAVLVYIFA